MGRAECGIIPAMRFFNSAGDLDGIALTRTYAEEVAVVISALDCVLDTLDDGKAVYASSELTSGYRLFELLRAHRVADAAQLRTRLGDKAYRRLLWEPNVSAARDFARELRRQLSARLTATQSASADANSGAFPGTVVVVEPAPFTAPSWDQPRYLAFWETLIRTRFKAVYFNQHWQYSNGCTFELAVAVDAGLPTFDASGVPLDLERGVELVGAAVRDVEATGLTDGGLREGLARLQRLGKTPIPSR